MNFIRSADKTRWLLVITVFLIFIICCPLHSATEKDTITARSISGQFTVRSPYKIPPLPASKQPTNQIKLIELDPNFLVVVCERIKGNILLALNQKDEWKGSVLIRIYPAQTYLDPVWVNARYSDKGWVYYVDFPSVIEMNRLIRAVVGVVLQEIADRKAGSKPAELPPWLPPAFTLNIHLTAPDIAIMERFTKKVRVERITNPINLIKRHIVSITPLTWDELSWPTDEALMDNSITNQYSLCSYIFMHEVLQLPDGVKKMKEFFTILPARWNWQVAFVEAFKPHFYSMRDVEKWWSVTIASITGRTGLKTLTFEESLKKLDDILNSPVKIPTRNTNTNQIIKIPIQQVIAQYSYSQHRQILREKISELSVLRQNSHPAITRLVDDYKEALQIYLDRRYRSGFGSELPPYTSDSPKLTAKNIMSRLDILDVIRSDFEQHGYEMADVPTPAFADPLVLQPQTNSFTATPPTTPKKRK